MNFELWLIKRITSHGFRAVDGASSSLAEACLTCWRKGGLARINIWDINPCARGVVWMHRDNNNLHAKVKRSMAMRSNGRVRCDV